jgi:transcriptional regulator with XRE-family HTH domain
MPSSHPTLGPNLRRFREEKGLNLRQLGAVTGFPFSLISRWERRMADPDYGQTLKLALALGIPPDWLWNVSQMPAPPAETVQKKCT